MQEQPQCTSRLAILDHETYQVHFVGKVMPITSWSNTMGIPFVNSAGTTYYQIVNPDNSEVLNLGIWDIATGSIQMLPLAGLVNFYFFAIIEY